MHTNQPLGESITSTDPDLEALARVVLRGAARSDLTDAERRGILLGLQRLVAGVLRELETDSETQAEWLQEFGLEAGLYTIVTPF